MDELIQHREFQKEVAQGCTRVHTRDMTTTRIADGVLREITGTVRGKRAQLIVRTDSPEWYVLQVEDKRGLLRGSQIRATEFVPA